jgi:hypothetical protein
MALFACWHLKELKCCAFLASSEHPDGSNSCTCIQMLNNTENYLEKRVLELDKDFKLN